MLRSTSVAAPCRLSSHAVPIRCRWARTSLPARRRRAPDGGRRRSRSTGSSTISGPAVVPLPGQLGQGHEHVELGQHGGGRLHPPPLGGHGVAQLHEQLVLQLLRLLVGREHLFFVFLQLRRDVPLGVLDRLLADVFGGNLLAVGVGDLDVVAEHLVEADLEIRNAGPLGLLGLIAGDPLLAAAGQFAQVVELGAESRRE